MLTGESLPVFKEKGVSVSAGTINWVSLPRAYLHTTKMLCSHVIYVKSWLLNES